MFAEALVDLEARVDFEIELVPLRSVYLAVDPLRLEKVDCRVVEPCFLDVKESNPLLLVDLCASCLVGIGVDLRASLAAAQARSRLDARVLCASHWLGAMVNLLRGVKIAGELNGSVQICS